MPTFRFVFVWHGMTAVDGHVVNWVDSKVSQSAFSVCSLCFSTAPTFTHNDLIFRQAMFGDHETHTKHLTQLRSYVNR